MRPARSRTPQPSTSARGSSSSTGPSSSSTGPSSGHIDFDSLLAKELVRCWCWGHKSASQVQREAKLAYDDQ
eukprot:6928131-Alexandrium_andersonii.AAC.1